MVTNYGLWTICVFRVMTFKRPEMTFKASEYMVIKYLTISCQFPLICNITRLYYIGIQTFENPRVFSGL